MLDQAQHRRQNQKTGVADLHTAVIVVQGVGNDAGGHGSILNRDFEAGAKYGCLGRPAELGHVTCDGLADRLDSAGQGGSQTVQRRALGLLHSVARYVLVAGVHYEPGNFLSSAHYSPLLFLSLNWRMLPGFYLCGNGSGPMSFLNSSTASRSRGMSLIVCSSSSGICGSAFRPVSFVYSLKNSGSL